MDNKTVQYKRTLRGSVGAGVSALFNGNGRRYYILEHKDASKYHKAGESQKIIIDQIELGRDANCQVRFDETFQTVSRRHAAIIKDGDRWKLVQLSKTNSTFLNGRPVENEWYLENGDEIQLSVGGPRMGFIVPAGKQSLVSSIKMTERLELFRKQALRPYKAAIACLACVLVLALAGLTTWNVMMQMDFNEQIAKAEQTISGIIGKNAELDSLLAVAQREQARQDSLIKKYRGQVKVVHIGSDANLSAMLANVEDDVFFLRTTRVIVTDGEDEVEIDGYGWHGTGFLTTDGRFITAKHCVNGWLFPRCGGMPSGENAQEIIPYLVAGMNTQGWKIIAYIEARSKSKVLRFKSTDFVMDHSSEHNLNIAEGMVWREETLMSADWAYIRTGQRGNIVVDASKASSLPVGADLHVLGFPHGWGAIDTYNFNCLYGSCKTSRNGLDDGVIRVSARNYESGNSGGPVFYNDNGKLKAIGIVSYGQGDHNGGLCSISNMN